MKIKDKLINIIEKYDCLILVLLIVTPIFALAISENLLIGDELWNFQNAYKMYNGFQIYKECNVIITPIFFYIAQIFFKIIGGNILAFRIYNGIIFLIFFFFIYKIFKALRIKKINGIAYTLILFLIYTKYIEGGANYNILSVVFGLIGIWLILEKKDRKYYNFLQGIIIYLITFTKQNVGVFYVIGLILVEIFDNYKNKKVAIKNLIYQTIIAGICIIINLGIMLYQGILYDFINYCFLGMNEFAINNFAIEQGNESTIIGIIISGVLIYVINGIFIKKNIIKFESEQEKRNITILTIMAIPINLKIFPILNSYHTIFGFLFTFMIMLYLLDKIIIKTIAKKDELENALLLIILTFAIAFTSNGVKRLNFKRADLDITHPYYSSLKNEYLEEKMNNVNNYIDEKESEGKKVLFVSMDSCLYMIPRKRNNGDFDLPFVGNFGSKGTQGFIEEIKQLDKNVLILIDKEEPFWQIPYSVREYIMLNWTQIEEIDNYYVMANYTPKEFYENQINM